MAGNQVVLSFAGDTKPLEDSFDRVGGASKRMGEKVSESEDSFGRAGEAADGAESKAQGFADVLGGTTDVAGGFGEVMKGNVVEGLIGVGGGLADLSGGLASFLIPALGKAKTAMLGLNFSFLTSPITWIVLGIVALIAVIVLIATKTDWFQRAWRAAWGWIKDAASNTWEFIKKIPGWIGGAFSKIASVISAPFRTAFNFIADAWNNTIGRLSWSVPGWVPGIGGKTISVPHIPRFHSGGVVPGTPGSDQLAILQAGERVETRGSGGSGEALVVASDGSLIGDALVEILAAAVKRRGGNVQNVLGFGRG